MPTRKDVPHKGYQVLHGQSEGTVPPVEGVVVEEVRDGASMALVPVPDNALGDVLSVDHEFASAVRFGSTERPPVRRLTWLTGNNDQYIGKKKIEAAAGLYLDMPNEDEMSPWDYELQDAMEELCERGQAREVAVHYIDEKTKEPRPTLSWQFMDPALFVVCQGVPSKDEMDKDISMRWGVAYAWPQGGKSRLRFHCFIQQLMKVGYAGPFLVSFSSYVTSKALGALRDHEYVLRFVDKQRRELGINFEIPYYFASLTLKVSIGTITAGSVERGGTKQVNYPVAVIPRLSVRNMEAARAFLAGAIVTDEQAEALEYNAYVEECADWSVKESRRILEGRDFDVDAAPTSDGTIILDDKDSPF